MKKDNTDFNFFVPINIEKASTGTGNDKVTHYKISGIASTNDEDSQGEILEPNGFDLSSFLKSGYFNLEHQSKNDPTNIVGEPTNAVVRDNKLFVEGILYGNSAKAKKIIEVSDMLEKAGSNRRLGFSIEGKKLKVDPSNEKRILKARIHGCAITSTPVNGNTIMQLMKGEQQEDYVDYEYENDLKDRSILLDIVKSDGERVTVDKEFNVKIEKAMSAGTQTGTELVDKPNSGASLKKESLEDDLKILTNKGESIKILAKKKDKFTKKGKEKIKKAILNFKNW